jgi:hypothetical protein
MNDARTVKVVGFGPAIVGLVLYLSGAALAIFALPHATLAAIRIAG